MHPEEASRENEDRAVVDLAIQPFMRCLPACLPACLAEPITCALAYVPPRRWTLTSTTTIQRTARSSRLGGRSEPRRGSSAMDRG